MNDSFDAALATRRQEVIDSCANCGACFDICPMTGPAEIKDMDGKLITSGIIDILKGQPGMPSAKRWAEVCSGSGSCIPACPHGVNPRFMLTLARLEVQKTAGEEDCHNRGGTAFSSMSRGVRVLSRLQLPTEILSRFTEDSKEENSPDVVFYTGCNVLKTPHIALLCLDILDALKVSYKVMGGPKDCCGVLQFRTGDTKVAGRIAYRTTDRFIESKAQTILSWCPTCQVQLGENVIPVRAVHDQAAKSLSLEAFVVYLANNLDKLQPLLINRVEKRVGLHEHPGVEGVTSSAISLIRSIPGIEFVDLEQPSVGWMCNTLQPLPQYKRDLHRGLLEAAAEAGVTTLAGVYHACHRDLCAHETQWPFEVINFLELIGESMGITRVDQFKRLKAMQDVDAVIADVLDLIEEHGMKLEEVRQVIARDLLGEQPLPLTTLP
jgi:Fe-S oxidoreductase